MGGDVWNGNSQFLSVGVTRHQEHKLEIWSEFKNQECKPRLSSGGRWPKRTSVYICMHLSITVPGAYWDTKAPCLVLLHLSIVLNAMLSLLEMINRPIQVPSGHRRGIFRPPSVPLCHVRVLQGWAGERSQLLSARKVPRACVLSWSQFWTGGADWVSREGCTECPLHSPSASQPGTGTHTDPGPLFSAALTRYWDWKLP